MEKNIKNLLDKYFDLIGEDSSIIKGLKNKKSEEESKVSFASDEIKKFEETISTNENKLNAYNTTGQDAVDKLKKFNDDEANIVMEITEDKKNNIMELSKKATESLPKMIELVTAEIEKAKNEKAAAIERKEISLNMINDLDLKIEEVTTIIKELNDMFDTSIKGELDATPKVIIERIQKLNNYLEERKITDDEAAELSKELLYPRYNLIEYASLKKAAETKSLKDIMSEAKEQATDISETKKEVESEEDVFPELTGLSAMEEAIKTSEKSIADTRESLNTDVIDYLKNDLHRNEFDIDNNDKLIKNITREDLINSAEKLKSVGIDPRNMSISTLINPDKMISTLEKLQENGIELDSKEIEKYSKTLEAINDNRVSSIVASLNKFYIPITKPNGKTQIELFTMNDGEINRMELLGEDEKSDSTKLLTYINQANNQETNNSVFTTTPESSSFDELMAELESANNQENESSMTMGGRI